MNESGLIIDWMTIPKAGWYFYTHKKEGWKYISDDNKDGWNELSDVQKRRALAVLIDDIGAEGVADYLLAGKTLEGFIADAQFYLDCEPLLDVMNDNDLYWFSEGDEVEYRYREEESE